MNFSRASLASLFILLFLAVASQAQVTAHYINVGQAESILLEFNSAAILIDAGGEDTGNDRDLDHLIGYLNDFFERRTDLNRTLYSVIVSHPHIDHTRHLPAIFDMANRFRVLNFVDGGQRGTKIGMRPVNDVRRIVRQRRILRNVIRDSEIGRDGYTTAHLAALRDSASQADVRFLAGSRMCENENNDSLLVLVKYKEATFLFGGDAETEDDSKCSAEVPEVIKFYRQNRLLDVDVYKVGHHGSHNATSDAFMSAMTPEISVISAGDLETRAPDRYHAFQFGHPREEAFLRLQRFTTGTRPRKRVYAMDGAGDPPGNRPPGKPVFREITEAVYCTCWDGDVRVKTNADGTRFEVETSR